MRAYASVDYSLQLRLKAATVKFNYPPIFNLSSNAIPKHLAHAYPSTRTWLRTDGQDGENWTVGM